MVFIINCFNKSENEQSYTSNLISLDRNTDYEMVSTRSILLYSWYTISSQFKTIRLNTGKKIRKNGRCYTQWVL